MTSTLRLPPALKAQATAYASQLGISLNALCAVALRDYLDLRVRATASTTGPLPVVEPSQAVASRAEATAQPAPSGVGLAGSREVKVPLGQVAKAMYPPTKRRSKRQK